MVTYLSEYTPAPSNLLPSAAQMAAFDAGTIADGIPSRELMERAGRAMCEAICARYGAPSRDLDKIVIFCGPGNNGGDGIVIARELVHRGLSPEVVLVQSEKYSADLQIQLTEYRKTGATILLSDKSAPSEQIVYAAEHATLIIDALLGTGQKDAPRGSIATLVELIKVAGSRSGARIVAADIPTGINADSGEVYSPAVNADLTLTVQCIKRGLVQYPARKSCGDIVQLPVGISPHGACEFSLATRDSIPRLPKRAPDAHKGSFGSVLILGGSRAMPGAALLSAYAALRTGAGLVYKAEILQSRTAAPHPCPVPELILELVQSGSGNFGVPNVKQLAKRIAECSAIVLGPGLGTRPDTARFVLKILESAQKEGVPTVLDADGLNFLAISKVWRATTKAARAEMRSLLENTVLTPHPGEMGRLLGKSIAEIQRDRYAAVQRIQERIGGTVLLKGAATIVCGANGGAVNTCGNPYMATAGAGDVLSGIVAALIAQGMRCFDAAVSGAYLHGTAGDLAYARLKAPLIASDIIAEIPRAFAVVS